MNKMNGNNPEQNLKVQQNPIQNQAQSEQQGIANGEINNEKAVLSGWISYIALGTFRIDDGQSIEGLFPPNSLSAEEKKSIAMISFPDTQSLNQSNDLMLEYCFRMKIREYPQLGFVFFYRKKDATIDRGYIQKSIVIITKLPLINFYQQILQHLGEMFYEQRIPSDDIIKKAILDIESWPEPENSKLYKLEFLGLYYTVSIPSYLLKESFNRINGLATLATNQSPLKDKNECKQNNKYNQIQDNVDNNGSSNRNGTNNKLNQKDNSLPSFEEQNCKNQLPKSISHQDIRLKNTLKINENNYNTNHQQREDNKSLAANFFSVKNINNHKINFQDKEQENQEYQEEQDNDLPNIEMRMKQRSNSLETKQDFSLSKQVKQKNNLSEILKLNDAQEEGLFQEINVFRHVQFNKLHSLWPIWEMVLVNQPFLLTANTPSECSAAILGFISLISPLQFAGDYRPYFTVYDTEYKKINIEYEQNMLRTYILGTCNPLFQLIMKNYPVIIGFDTKSEQQQLTLAKKSKKPIQAIKYNRTKIDIIPDNKQLEKLLLNSTTPEAMAINNTLVRKHFRVLTNLFLEPIHKYLDEQPNEIKTFEEKSFLAYLKNKKSPLKHLYKDTTSIQHLYERFLRSMNFLRFIRNKPNVIYQNPFAPQKK